MPTPATLPEIFSDDAVTAEQLALLTLVDKLIQKRLEEAEESEFGLLGSIFSSVTVDIDGDGVKDA